eukprot:98962-Amphidinium_carterae.1
MYSSALLLRLGNALEASSARPYAARPSACRQNLRREQRVQVLHHRGEARARPEAVNCRQHSDRPEVIGSTGAIRFWHQGCPRMQEIIRPSVSPLDLA